MLIEKFYKENGYVVIPNLINKKEINNFLNFFQKEIVLNQN